MVVDAPAGNFACNRPTTRTPVTVVSRASVRPIDNARLLEHYAWPRPYDEPGGTDGNETRPRLNVG